DRIDVARAARDDQPDFRALALDQRVDRRGRAVNEVVDGLGIDIALLDAVDDAVDMVARRGQALGLIKPSAAIIESDQIGKRPPNINRQKNHDVLPLTNGWAS